MVGEVALELGGVVRIYDSDSGPVQALRGIDLRVDRGSVTAVIGPSGSGKSTFLRLAGALDRPTAGDVVIDGHSLAPLSARGLRLLRRRHLGFVFQRPGATLLAHRSIGAQIAAEARRHGTDPARSELLLDRVGLGDRGAHRPHELSGGEQQRAAFVRAAVKEPSLIVADEPTAELDSASTARVRALMRELADQGNTVLVASHDPELVGAADHVVHLRDGAIQSETRAGVEYAVIDSAGRLQLPAEVLDWFPERQVAVEIDRRNRHVGLRRP